MQFLTQHNYHKKIILFSSTILAISAILLSIVIVWLLYETAFQEKQADLVETAQSQARLIEAVAHFDAKYSVHDVEGGPFAATLSQIIEAHKRYKGLGETGEFTLAKREGHQIVFLLSHRHFDLENPKPVSWDLPLAEPMRQALQGKSGTLVGLDYRGKTVLAAYEPLPFLNLGIVAKVDLAEIRAPFIRTGLIALGITLLIIVAGVIVIIRLVHPIIIRMTESEAYLQAILDNAPLMIDLKDTEGQYLFTNKHYQNLFRHDPTGQLISEVFPEEVAYKLRKNDLTVLKSETSTILEEQIPHTEGLHTYLSVKFPIINYQGKISAVCSISTDITERKCTEEALQKNEILLNEAQKIAHIGHWEWNIPNNKLWWSDEIYRIFGLIPQQFGATYEAFLNTIHPDERKLVNQAVEQALSENTPYHIDHRIVLSNGMERIVHEQAEVTWNEIGQAIRMVGTVQDITEHKQAEKALQESEERFRALFESAPDAIFLADIETGEIIDANFAASQLMQKPREEMIGLHQSQLHPPETEQFVRQKFIKHSRLAQEDKNIPIEHVILRSDGHEVPVEILAHQIYIQGKPILQGVFRDITERKQAEEKLRRNEERFRKIFEDGPIGMVIVNMEHRFVKLNTAFCQMLGYTASELMGLTVTDISYPDDMPKNREYVKQTLNGEIPFYQMEKRYIRKDKQLVWGHLTVSILHNATGEPIYLLGKIEDITARKRAEEALKESENRYRSVINALQEGIVLQNVDGNIIACNPSAERILGLTQQQILGRTSVDPRWQTIYEEGSPFPTEERPGRVTLRTGKACLNVVMGIYKPDGILRWVSINSQPLLKEGENNPYAVVCSFVDITERKRAEDALQKSEEHYRRILETTSEGYWLINQNAETIDVNQSLCNMLGYRREEMLGKKPQDFADAENFKIFQYQISRRNSTPHRSYEITLKHKNSRDIFTHFSATIIKNETPPISFALVTDMTASKQAAYALRDSEERFRTLVSHIPGIVYRCANDKDWSMEYISGEVDKISGYPTSDFINNQVRSYASVIHPDDQNMVDQLVQDGVNNKRPYTIEYRIIHKNEPIKWVHEKGRGIFNQKGQLLWLDGVIFDISERKRTEKTLQETNKFLEKIMNSTTNAIFVIDLDGKFINVNQACSKITGYPINELIVQPFSIVLAPEIRTEINEQFLTVAVDGKTVSQYETKIIRQDGSEAIVTFSIAPMLDDGTIVSVVGTAEDITEHKHAEAALKQSQQSYESLVHSIDGVVWEADAKTFQFTFVSQQAEKFLGYPSENWLKPTFWLDHIHPDDQNWAPAFCMEATFKKQDHEFEYRMITADNQTIWLRDLVSVIIENDQPVKICGVMLDITERKQAEQTLKENEQNLQAIFNSITEAFIIADLEGNIADVNQSAVQMYGYPKEEFVTLHASQVICPEYHSWLTDFIQTAQSDQMASAQTVDFRKDGTFFYTEVNGTMLKYNGKKHLLAIIRDVTKRKLVEDALKESEERFRSLVEQAADAIFVHDLEGHFIDVNQSACESVGYTREELLNLSVADVEKGVSLEQLKALWQPIKFGEPVTLEGNHRHKNGTLFQVEIRLGLIKWEGSQYILAAARNITERKRAEEKLIIQAKILESMAEGVNLATESGHIFLTNPAFDQMFGYHKNELIGKHVSTLNSLSSEENLLFVNNIIADLQTKGGWEGEFNNQKKEGTHFISHAYISVLEISGQQYFVTVQEDITERKQAETALTQAKEQAESANRAKSEFLATMSHEIRTPMNAVLGFSELLSELVTDQQQHSYLDSIKTAGKTLLTLIDDILDLAKIEAGRLDIQYEAINPYNIFEELKQIFFLKIAEKQLDLIVDIDKNLPLALILDEARLRQVLLNLIGNAVKFTEKGSIILRAQKADKMEKSKIDLLISVEDSGIGIPLTQQEMIFEAFRQQDGQSTRQYGGTGLGLAITKRLVEMMNGDISVTSTVGKGSIFNMTLRDVDISPTSVPVKRQEAENILSISFEKARVLVVDDIESNRVLIREWLSQVNLEVIEADNGQTALSMAEQCQPHLILMDIRMPVMDGYETTKRLKNNLHTQKIPIIALTASVMMRDQTQIKTRFGFDGYLYKPVQANDLFAELSRFLTHKPNIERQTAVSCRPKKELSLENIVQVPELIGVIENNILPQWKEINGVWEIETLENFSENVIQLGKIHNVPIFIDYAEKLREFAHNFDIRNIEQTFNQFYDILFTFIKKEDNDE